MNWELETGMSEEKSEEKEMRATKRCGKAVQESKLCASLKCDNSHLVEKALIYNNYLAFQVDKVSV